MKKINILLTLAITILAVSQFKIHHDLRIIRAEVEFNETTELKDCLNEATNDHYALACTDGEFEKVENQKIAECIQSELKPTSGKDLTSIFKTCGVK